MQHFPPIGPGDLPDTRLKGQPWHVGLLVSQSRAISVARRLFPGDVAEGADCRNGDAGHDKPCNFCAAANAQWFNRVREVRLAMIEAFR